jgi:tripartite-type tricarboxylate transporter receptor subunit TctC
VLNYFGLVAPRGTPPEVVERINGAIARLVVLPDVKARFNTDAIEAAPGTPAQLAQFIDTDYRSWQQVVARQNLKITAV